MQECKLFFMGAFFLVAGLGCSDARTQSVEKISASHPSKPSQFEPTQCGTLQGRVTWEGPVPSIPELKLHANLGVQPPRKLALTRPNPNVPVIDKESRGVEGAVVFLRGLDARKCKPWPHSPVQVEMRDRDAHVRQGNLDSRVGFVRRGDEVRMVSREEHFHFLRARGAAFFSLPFPDPGKPSVRKLEKTGLVELSSGAGYFWIRAYLFVDDNPYYARTDSQGRFEFTQVPEGDFKAVCWIPRWEVTGHERDPESGSVTRIVFAPPLELENSVHLERGNHVNVDFLLSAAVFAQNPSPSR